MSMLEHTFDVLQAERRKALIPFFTAGFPDLPTFKTLLLAAQDSGADLVEVGLPFSDPLADGPAIQCSSQQALAHGVNVAQTFAALTELHGLLRVPLVLMTYVNPLLAFGAQAFAAQARAAGCEAVILPDLPTGEDAALESVLAASGLSLIPLVAPTTTPARLQRVLRNARGFVYLVSVSGVTGARVSLPADLPQFVQRVRAESRLPLCVGFGIGSATLASEAAHYADGVIVGSALVDRIRTARDNTGAVSAVAALLADMRTALDDAAGAETAAEVGCGAAYEVVTGETQP